MSLVGTPRKPHLVLVLAQRYPGRLMSTMKHVITLTPFSGSVFAKITVFFANGAPVMNVFRPFRM
jgi:hypothetical protein